MPALLYGIGALALFAGLVMIGFGIPINEFSFGNTLISAGTTAGVGGLVIIGLGVVASQVRRLTEALTVQLPGRIGHPVEALENTVAASPAPPQGRVPFPTRPRPESRAVDPSPTPSAGAAPFEDSFAPTLRNPTESPVAVEDEISLSPRHPLAPAAQAGNEVARPSPGPALGGAGPGMVDKNREPAPSWRTPLPPAPSPQTRSTHTANFDAMWPAEAKLPKTPSVSETSAEARPDAISRESLAASKREPEAQKPRSGAILKSGVVDGMAYTLYVDGSIEAELPQGTLRFASINELRSHLAKNS